MSQAIGFGVEITGLQRSDHATIAGLADVGATRVEIIPYRNTIDALEPLAPVLAALVQIGLEVDRGRTLLGLWRNLRCETEWVTSRVEQDSPSVGRWLDRRDPGSQPLSLRRCGLQVCHREIQMDLLRDVARGPRRRLVVGDLHGAQPYPFSSDVHGRGGREHDLAPEHRGPELSERDWVGTVQRHESPSSDSHGLRVEAARIGGKP